MKRLACCLAVGLAGFLFASAAFAQRDTISAHPGVVSFVEGTVDRNGRPLRQPLNRDAALISNDTLSTAHDGKAEILLAPGAFFRIGGDSQVRMISPSLLHTQLEVLSGEAMLEVADLVKGNDVQILDRSASITVFKPGLYRFTGGARAAVAVLQGRADVAIGTEKTSLSKNRQAELESPLKSRRFSADHADDLYVWSNVRSGYNAADTYSAARQAYSGYGGNSFSYANTGFYDSGWAWNGMWNSWAWLPGTGAFFSPFGWGFYSPYYAAFAPIAYIPVVVRPGTVVTGPGTGTHPKPIPVQPVASTSSGATAAPARSAASSPSFSSGARSSGASGGGRRR
jgi:hypothetical protein